MNLATHLYFYVHIFTHGTIIIIRYELGLGRSVSTSSNSLFNGLPSRLCLFYYSALLLASCCCSFLLNVANLICIVSVSRQLVLLSTLPKIVLTFCGQKWRTWLFYWKFSSRLMPIDFFHPFFFLWVQTPLPYRRMGSSNSLYTFILEN